MPERFTFPSRLPSIWMPRDTMRPSSSDSAQLFLFAYVKLMLSSFFLCSESNPSNVEKNSSYFATKYAVFNLISISLRSYDCMFFFIFAKDWKI